MAWEQNTGYRFNVYAARSPCTRYRVNNVISFRNCIIVTINESFIFVLQNTFNFKIKKMNTAKLKAKLNKEKGKLKQKFAGLTDDDLLLEEGRRQEMIGKHQLWLAHTQKEIDKIMSELDSSEE